MFENFIGNVAVVQALEGAIRQSRIPQTILLSGPEGVGKATLVRRLAAALLGDAAKIEQDDLSRPENQAVISDREKLASDKRNEDPLLFSSHPDFITFCPEGPLRQISIQQMRLLKERAQFGPLKGKHRVFLIDGLDRANEQAANSLLKTLEEPPPYLILIATAQNAYDLLPTIRSRSVHFALAPLSEVEMASFGEGRGLTDSLRRMALTGGCPGAALTLDLPEYDQRRGVMLKLLEAASGRSPFGDWVRASEAISGKSEKLDQYLPVLYGLIEDILIVQNGAAGLRNIDIQRELAGLAESVTFEWLRKAVSKIDELVEMMRRNIQKGIALDALVLELRVR
jgi:DNA polymerase-3 subunit delta'